MGDCNAQIYIRGERMNRSGEKLGEFANEMNMEKLNKTLAGRVS